MKKYHSFFIRRLFVLWGLLMLGYGYVSGQERDADSVFVMFQNDTIPMFQNDTIPMFQTDTIPMFQNDTIPMFQTDTISRFQPDSISSLYLTGDLPPLDSIPALPDSLRRRFVMRFADPLDTLSNRIFAYKVPSRKTYSRIHVEIDTTLTLFDINNPVMRKYHAAAYLGNVGLSYYPISYGDRKRPSDYPFLDNVAVYLHDPEETTFYQTQFPYTLINFSSAGPKRLNETIFNLVHTQNVNKNLNLGLYYDTYSSIGDYVNQNTASNGFSLFSAYRGNQYSMYANFNWNNVRMRENGGLADVDDYIENPRDDPSGYSVRSTEGKTIMLNRSLHVIQSYSPAKISLRRKTEENDTTYASRFALVHTLRYEWNTREYTDTATYALHGKEPYFWGTLPRSVNTYDSLYFRRISNRFDILIREQARSKYTAGFSAGVLMEMDRYNSNMIPQIFENIIEPHVPPGTGWGGNLPDIAGLERTVNYRESKNHINTALTGSFFNHTGRFINWDINGRLYFTGYKAGDVNIDGNVQIHYYTAKGRNTLLLGGSIDNVNPGYFLNNFASNLIVWNEKFDLSQELRLRGEYTMPARKLKLGAYLSQLNNYIYFNKEALPEQASELLMTGTAYVEKDLRLGNFGFRFRLYGQYSSNEAIIPLPAFAGFQSTYFEYWILKNVMNMQLGWNIAYNTKYYAYSYMPATGMFHLQDEQKIGAYPFFDFFLNFQISHARVFIKTDGLNALLNNYIGRNNFMVYRHPTNEFRMKFGVSWAFYN